MTDREGRGTFYRSDITNFTKGLGQDLARELISFKADCPVSGLDLLNNLRGEHYSVVLGHWRQYEPSVVSHASACLRACSLPAQVPKQTSFQTRYASRIAQLIRPDGPVMMLT